MPLAIVARPDGTIFDRVAQELQSIFTSRGIEVRRLNSGFDLQAYAHLYLPYYFMERKTAWDVAMFTHLEDTENLVAKRIQFQAVAIQADVCVAMSNWTASLLPPWKTVVAEIPATKDFIRTGPIKILCPTLVHPNNRKNLDIIKALKIPGIEIMVTNGSVPQDQMPTCYNECDYVLVTGRNEGGPMAVKEAIALGKPVIAPNVGWCWEYPVIRYSGEQELVRILERLAPIPRAWDRFADTLIEACQRSPNGLN